MERIEHGFHLHKKDDRKDMTNNRPISLPSHIHKLITTVICDCFWIQKQCNRSDHQFVPNRLLEKSREHKFPLCIAFVDYRKTFDDLEHIALKIQGVYEWYMKPLEEANKGCTTDVTAFANSIRIPIKKRGRFKKCVEAYVRDQNLLNTLQCIS